jgi:hypothetical protein
MAISMWQKGLRIQTIYARLAAADYGTFPATSIEIEAYFYAKSVRIMAPATSLLHSHSCMLPCEVLTVCRQ